MGGLFANRNSDVLSANDSKSQEDQILPIAEHRSSQLQASLTKTLPPFPVLALRISQLTVAEAPSFSFLPPASPCVLHREIITVRELGALNVRSPSLQQ